LKYNFGKKNTMRDKKRPYLFRHTPLTVTHLVEAEKRYFTIISCSIRKCEKVDVVNNTILRYFCWRKPLVNSFSLIWGEKFCLWLARFEIGGNVFRCEIEFITCISYILNKNCYRKVTHSPDFTFSAG